MRASWRNYWLSIAILAAAAPLPGYVGNSQRTPLLQPLSDLSFEIGDWRGKDEPLNDRVRAILGTEDLLFRRYVDPRGQAMGLYVSYFSRQTRGEIGHSPKNCLPGAGWLPRRERWVPYPLPGKESAMINEVLYERAGRQQLVYYWFQERGRILASEYRVKWYLMWDAMTRQRTDGALLRVSAPVEESEEATRTRCLDFMRLALPRINEFLPD